MLTGGYVERGKEILASLGTGILISPDGMIEVKGISGGPCSMNQKVAVCGWGRAHFWNYTPPRSWFSCPWPREMSSNRSPEQKPSP